MIDDHDQVWRGDTKGRFCSMGKNNELVGFAMMFNLCTLGIPCIYYGTEQAFDRSASEDSPDRYIREAMFGSEFGAFRSKRSSFLQRAAFGLRFGQRSDQNQEAGDRIASRQAILEGYLWKWEELWTDKEGRRWTDTGHHPWSRLFADEEILCAINTDPDADHEVWINIDISVHPPGTTMTFLSPSTAGQVRVESKSGRSVVHLASVKVGGFVILKRISCHVVATSTPQPLWSCSKALLGLRGALTGCRSSITVHTAKRHKSCLNYSTGPKTSSVVLYFSRLPWPLFQVQHESDSKRLCKYPFQQSNNQAYC